MGSVRCVWCWLRSRPLMSQRSDEADGSVEQLMRMIWEKVLLNKVIFCLFVFQHKKFSLHFIKLRSNHCSLMQCIALCKYPSADASQLRSCNNRKQCDRLLSLWRSSIALTPMPYMNAALITYDVGARPNARIEYRKHVILKSIRIRQINTNYD